ncbi:hypothetical protein LPJ66_003267 [Kickxella alabastrina]|uniref:Uncharacterized protein n=1 Tax=Kickxella alabastrina TaxID=61397 RepID=A0ACC1IKJ7_9FUNG|nr:hypothetical protein LPJ66_003267 [Kickxella alabastrina]
MSFTHLTFQTLPSYIIDKIVAYTLALPASLEYDNSHSVGIAFRIIDNLSAVSHKWRTAALKNKPSSLEIQSREYSDRLYVLQYPEPPYRNDNCTICEPLIVKKIQFSIDFPRIFNGSALDSLKRILGPNAFFPSALQVILSTRFYTQCEPEHLYDAQYNISEFVGYLKRLVRSSTEFAYQNTGNYVVGGEQISLYLGSLGNQLFEGAKKIAHHPNNNNLPMPFDCSAILGLTHIEYNWLHTSNHFIQVIRISSQTLDTLTINSHWNIDLDKLIYNDDESGAAVTYPMLCSLYLDTANEDQSIADPTSCNFEPFPRLKSLRANTKYILDYEYLLCDCLDTLEYLKLFADDAYMLRLYSSSVFLDREASQLRCLILDCSDDDELEYTHMWTCQFMRWIICTMPSIQILQFSHIFNCSSLRDAICDTNTTFEHIQVLNMPSSSITMFTVISLLRALPHLSEITSLVGGYGDCPQDLVSEHYLAGMRSLYFPLGKNFKSWRIRDSPYSSELYVANRLITLAVICPSFLPRNVSNNMDADGCELVEDAFSSGHFGMFTEHIGWFFQFF